MIVHSTRLKRRNMALAKWMLCLYWVKSYCRKTLLAKKRLFLEFLLSGSQTVDLRSNLRAHWQRNAKRAIECAFAGRCNSSGSRIMSRFVEKCWKQLNLTYGDLWWPDLWTDLINDRTSFVMIFGALSNTAYRMSLRGSGAYLEGGVQTSNNPPRPAAGYTRVKPRYM